MPKLHMILLGTSLGKSEYALSSSDFLEILFILNIEGRFIKNLILIFFQNNVSHIQIFQVTSPYLFNFEYIFDLRANNILFFNHNHKKKLLFS